jgi:signal transduction histidine kinase
MFAEEREPFREVVRQVLADGKDRTFDHRLTCANGQTRWFHTGLSVVHAPGGGSELHGVSTDVTHLRPSVEAQRRQQVLTNVSRELLTQAQVIAGAAEVLQEAGELDGALGKVVETIVRERDRAERLAERVAGLDVA